MTTSEVFQRARRPEQKAARRSAILASARRLASAKGVRNVSLGDIAKDVGLTKSNVLRYFETREDIYLQLTADGYRRWAERVDERLAAVDDPGPHALAEALAEELARDPLFCDLLSDAAGSLEHNVSIDAVRAFKITALAAMDDLADTIAHHCAGLRTEQALEVVVATTVLATGLWPWANPPPVLVELYAEDASLARARVHFASRLRRLTETVINGLRRDHD